MSLSPTQLSIRDLKERGYTVAKTEHWNPFARITQDLFGFADLIAFNETEVLLVQTTTKSNLAARRNKIAANKVAGLWAREGRRVELHGWIKIKNRWQVVVE